LRAAVEEALDLTEDDLKSRYSVRDLKAFQIALPIYRKLCEELSDTHPAVQALRRVLEHLCRGCHRFARAEKAETYHASRDAASLVVCGLVLADSPAVEPLIHALEQELMAALAGRERSLPYRPGRPGS